MGTLTERQREELRLRWDEATLASQKSLAQFLGWSVIDARPDPLCWGHLWEPWQREICRALVPAVEQAAGIRRNYNGPRSFFCVLPRGHDKTGLIGRVCNWAIGFARHKLRGVAAASTKDQAGILLDSMRIEAELNPWIAKRLTTNRNEIYGPGGMLKVIPADAPTASGLRADLIVCDELTYWKTRELFDVLWSGREKRPDSIFLVITNAGIRQTWQWQLLQEAKADPKSWYVYEAPPNRTLASWMTPERIESMRRFLRPGFARRVLDNVWIDATERPLLEWEWIQAAHSLDCLQPAGLTAELFMGVDFGRTKDKTTIATLEQRGLRVVTRDLTVLENTPFAEQEDIIRRKLEDPRVVSCHLDKGAIGWTTTENLERDFPFRCIGVHLGSHLQGEIAVLMEHYFRSGQIDIPADDTELDRDLQLVEEVETANGRPAVRTKRDAQIGHADRFWAYGLGLYGMPMDGTGIYYPPVGFAT